MGQFCPIFARKSGKNDSIENPKNTRGRIYPCYHFPKFQENSSSHFWVMSRNGPTDHKIANVLPKWAHFAHLRAIQSKLRFHWRKRSSWAVIWCDLKKIHLGVFEKIGTKYPKDHFGPILGHKSGQNDSIGNPKKTPRDIDPYNHLSKFEKNSSSHFWVTLINGQENGQNL